MQLQCDQICVVVYVCVHVYSLLKGVVVKRLLELYARYNICHQKRAVSEHTTSREQSLRHPPPPPPPPPPPDPVMHVSHSIRVASFPGLHPDFISQPWSHGYEIKSGRRPGDEASIRACHSDLYKEYYSPVTFSLSYIPSPSPSPPPPPPPPPHLLLPFPTPPERHHVDLVRCPEYPEREGEYVIQVCAGSFRVWTTDLMPKARVMWEWPLKQLRRIHWHRNVNKLEVEAGRCVCVCKCVLLCTEVYIFSDF